MVFYMNSKYCNCKYYENLVNAFFGKVLLVFFLTQALSMYVLRSQSARVTVFVMTDCRSFSPGAIVIKLFTPVIYEYS
jgi:hypothetical protein